jgi:predicted DsbA family dithiol-disulfide isomerase
MIEEAGFLYAPPSFAPNSMRSLQLGELARVRGVFEEVHPQLFSAYWSEGRDIGDEETLVSIGASAGLPAAEIAEVFRKGTYRERIDVSTRTAVQLGINGVPAWVIDGENLVSGAQPVDVFERVMARLGHKPVVRQP